jgi:hypothetical protein
VTKLLLASGFASWENRKKMEDGHRIYISN